MLTDEMLQKASEELVVFRNNHNLEQILDHYASLLENYKRLKSDYEEERDGRERYKQLANARQRDPYVLVLVDGNTYVFQNRFLTNGSNGGANVAGKLNAFIESVMRGKGLADLDVVIRVYVDLVGLSRSLNDGRDLQGGSIASFVNGFNTARGLTELIDVGGPPGTTESKMKAMLGLFSASADCRHVFVAARLDNELVDRVKAYAGNGNGQRFSMLSTTNHQADEEYRRLGLHVEDVPDVFTIRGPIGPKVGLLRSPGKRPGSPAQPGSGQSSGDIEAGLFFPAAKSRFGRGGQDVVVVTPADKRASVSDQNPLFRFSPPLGPSQARSLRGKTLAGVAPFRPKYELKKLPKEIQKGFVVLNKNNHRLDAFIMHPPKKDLSVVVDIPKGRKKMCNQFHLTGKCAIRDCTFDHAPIPGNIKHALAWSARTAPCRHAGSCRRADCFQGHVCQKPNCRTHRGGPETCRFPKDAVAEDYEGMTWTHVGVFDGGTHAASPVTPSPIKAPAPVKTPVKTLVKAPVKTLVKAPAKTPVKTPVKTPGTTSVQDEEIDASTDLLVKFELNTDDENDINML